MANDFPTTRDLPLDPKASALLFIDVQIFSVRRDGGEFKEVGDANIAGKYGYYFDRLEKLVIPNGRRLQMAFRATGIEVLYTTIESLTKDGRDRSLDYKITGFNVPKGSWDGKVIDEIAPGDDEIVLPKTSSSVFVSTHVDYLLRNLGVRQLVLCGLLTDQCVESAIRDACGALAAILLPSVELDGPDQVWLYRIADGRLAAATPMPDMQQPHPTARRWR